MAKSNMNDRQDRTAHSRKGYKTARKDATGQGTTGHKGMGRTGRYKMGRDGTRLF